MAFQGDERAQSVQVGAVLLFAVLIVAFSSYQAFVIPNQNSEIEFNHNQEVHSQMQDLRNAIVSVPGASSSTSVSIQLGTRYPSRALGQNPGPPTGSLRTNGTQDESKNVTISNAAATGETGDYWNGDDRDFNSGTLVYSPNYNVYGQAPDTYYEHSVAYNQFRRGNITLSGQTIVDGREITLVALNGSLSRTSSGSTSVDVRPVSRSTRTVRVTNASGEQVNVTILSRLSANKWENDILEDELTTNGGHVEQVTKTGERGPFNELKISLEPGVDYRLRLAKAGIGTQVTGENATYVTDIDGNGTTISPGQTQRLVAEVRDEYNNPVTSRTVNATVVSGGGSVMPASRTSDDDGRVAFIYEAPSTTTEAEIRVDIADAPSSQQIADFTVTVSNSNSQSSSDGAYATTWLDPSQQGVDCSTDPCTFDASVTRSIDLTATTDPTAAGAEVRYTLSNRTIADLDPRLGRTNESGDNETMLTATDSGTTYVYTASGGSGDRVQFEIVNIDTVQIAYVTSGSRELNTIDSGGRIKTYTDDYARAIAPVDKYNGVAEIPYVNNSNFLKVVEPRGSTRQITGDAQYSDATIAAGDRDADGTIEYYYTETVNDNLQVTEGGTTTTLTETNGNCQANLESGTPINNGYGAAGLADFDGNGQQNLILVNGNDKVAYYDFQRCDLNEITTTFDVNSGNGGVGISAPFEYNGRPVVAFVNGDGDFVIVDKGGNINGNGVTLDSSYGGAAASPLGARDWDDDGELELVHIDASDNHYIKHAGIQDSDLTLITGENNGPEGADRDSGTR